MEVHIKMILLLSFITSIVLGLIIIPLLRKLKIGQFERNDGPESHLSKQGTPTMGGIIFIATIIIGYITCLIIEQETAKKLLPMFIISVGSGTVGLVDDIKKVVFKNTEGLKPSYKMFGLLIIAVMYVLYLVYFSGLGANTYIPILKTYIDLAVPLYVLFNVCVILGTTNAVNLTDGVDGLATSVSLIIITCLTVIGILFNVTEVAIFGSIIIGACLGFLIFNLHPAKVMMGDTGSLLLGGVISGIAIYLKMPLLLLLIAIIPVIETVSVMMQVLYYQRTGNRIFKMAPLHHHFELSGWNENKVVSIFSIITLLVCIVGLFIV